MKSTDLIGHIKFLPWRQFACSVTRPFLSAKGVACETTPGSPPESLDFSASSTDN